MFKYLSISLAILIFPVICQVPTVIYLNNDNDIPLTTITARTYNNDVLEGSYVKVQIGFILLTIGFFMIPTLLILIHLSRNIPINHQSRAFHYVQDDDAKKYEHAFVEMVKKGALDKASDSSFFFFQKWTGYISTARKLLKTFEHDFDPTKAKMTPEQFLKETNREVEVMTLTANKVLEDDL